MVVQNLMSLTQGANYGELTSLEEMMGLLVRGKFIPAPVVKMLWDIFTHRYACFFGCFGVCTCICLVQTTCTYIHLVRALSLHELCMYSFTCSAGNVTQSHSRSAVLLLSMIAGAEREVVKTNLKLLVAHGLNSEGENPGN